MILFSSVFILALSYFIYKDKINFLQGTGLTIIIIGVLVISFFKAADPTVVILNGEIVTDPSLNPWAKMICITTGLLAAGSFALEIILVKELTKLSIDGTTAGMFYTLFVGIFGLIALSVYSLSGFMANEIYTTYDYGLIIVGSCFESVGMISQIYAASI